MLPGEFKISTLCSLQFAAVNRDKVKDVVSVHIFVLAINGVVLYRGLTVINHNNISSLRLLMYLAL
jgi:hypothetical protein